MHVIPNSVTKFELNFRTLKYVKLTVSPYILAAHVLATELYLIYLIVFTIQI